MYQESPLPLFILGVFVKSNGFSSCNSTFLDFYEPRVVLLVYFSPHLPSNTNKNDKKKRGLRMEPCGTTKWVTRRLIYLLKSFTDIPLPKIFDCSNIKIYILAKTIETDNILVELINLGEILLFLNVKVYSIFKCPYSLHWPLFGINFPPYRCKTIQYFPEERLNAENENIFNKSIIAWKRMGGK